MNKLPLLFGFALAFVLSTACLAADKPTAAPKKQTCCEIAISKGKECDHKCCIAAHRAGKSCEKCNPTKEDLAAQKAAKKTK